MRLLILKAWLAVFGRGSLAAARWSGVVLGWLLWQFPNRSRRVTKINLDLCRAYLGASTPNAKLTLRELGKNLTELGVIWNAPAEHIAACCQEQTGETLFNHALARGQGVLLATPHLGSWEYLALWLSLKCPLTAMYSPTKSPQIARLITHRRSRFGARLVPTNTAGIRAMHAALKRGETVMLLPDQEPPWGAGVFADFLGQPAYSMTLLSKLAQRSGATVLTALAARTRQGYRIQWGTVNDNLQQLSLVQSVTAVNQAMEQLIRRVPEQYAWEYKRFRILPDNQRRPYR